LNICGVQHQGFRKRQKLIQVIRNDAHQDGLVLVVFLARTVNTAFNDCGFVEVGLLSPDTVIRWYLTTVPRCLPLGSAH
jgi:hypothetical protein